MKKEIMDQLQLQKVSIDACEVDGMITLTGNHEDLNNAAAVLEASGYSCDNGMVGGLPKEYGSIMICDGDERFGDGKGFLVCPKDQDEFMKMGDACLSAALHMMYSPEETA